MYATYSPEDNKLRLYAGGRLDSETYARVKAAGFKWAPRQELFVAPMWTPGRADLLTELCGDIGDEDTSLVERAEERADRFEGYGANRAADAEHASDAVSAIADNIPFGQPILVGHHSEKRARKDAEKIENGMRRAVKMWETSKYWEYRAAGALRHAKYKELPAVRLRRIKKIEADKRRQERAIQKAEMFLKLWTECGNETDSELQKKVALRIANVCWLHLPRKKGDKPDFDGQPTAHCALTDSYPTLYAPRTLDEIVEHAKKVYPLTIAGCQRWIDHYDNRLTYERAMLGDYQPPAKPKRAKLPPIANFPGEGTTEITKAQWAAKHKDYKGTRIAEATEKHGRYRYRCMMGVRRVAGIHTYGAVFIADQKRVDPPPPVEETPAPMPPPAPPERFESRPVEREQPSEFDAMRESLRAGVQTVSAPQLFPTPPELARRMVEAANVRAGDSVLEPSAGTGNILNEVRTAQGNLYRCTAVEISVPLSGRLRDTYGDQCTVKTGDFLVSNGDLGKFDSILMNPPFANNQDIDHVMHAYSFLKPGGRLVAIMSAHGFFASDKKSKGFREWLGSLGGEAEDLPRDTFKASGTSVSTKLVTLTA